MTPVCTDPRTPREMVVAHRAAVLMRDDCGWRRLAALCAGDDAAERAARTEQQHWAGLAGYWRRALRTAEAGAAA